MAKSRLKKTWKFKRAERGFTLVEVLIATAIFSFSVAGLFAVYTNVVVATEMARDRALARLHLESLLAQVGVTTPLQQGKTEGAFGDAYLWRLDIDPYGTSAEHAASLVAAWEVTASVDWTRRGGTRSLSLTVLRLGEERQP